MAQSRRPSGISKELAPNRRDKSQAMSTYPRITRYISQAEQELLELWSSVEKEKAAARERGLLQARSIHTQQRQTRAGIKVGPQVLKSHIRRDQNPRERGLPSRGCIRCKLAKNRLFRASEVKTYTSCPTPPRE